MGLAYAPKHIDHCRYGTIIEVSSRLVRQEYEDYLAQKYWKGAFWSGSYFIASCSGVTVDQIKAYVQSQDRPLS